MCLFHYFRMVRLSLKDRISLIECYIVDGKSVTVKIRKFCTLKKIKKLEKRLRNKLYKN